MRSLKPKFWDLQKISFWSILLLPFSLIYLIGVHLNKIFKIPKKYEIPIICIGNIYVGGTGKTPLVREVFNKTKSLGKNPAIIKKNYDYVQDEINMLKKTGKVFSSPKRDESITLAITNKYDVAILDDGFQDFSIKPNFSILCFNSRQLFGNGLVLPSGPLRESLSSIKRADCIIINGDKNLEFENNLTKKMGRKKIPIFYSNYKIKNIEKFIDKEIIAFAGIGNPSNFFDLLKKNNIDLKQTYSFPDHYEYSQKDLDKILGDKSIKIITTEKDFYRLNDAQQKICDYLEVNLEIEDEDKLMNLIKNNI